MAHSNCSPNYILPLCQHPKIAILNVCLSSCLSSTFAISAMLPLHESRKVQSKSIIFPSCLRRQFTAIYKPLQSTVWVWSFSSITLFHLCIIYPTVLLFLQLHPQSNSDYNLIHILKVKICGYKYSAKYLKNTKASARTFFPLRMTPHFIPEKAHVLLLYGLPSMLLSVVWVCFFPLFSSVAGYVRFQRSFLSCLKTMYHSSRS